MIFANSFASAPVSIGSPGSRLTPISSASGVAVTFSRAIVSRTSEKPMAPTTIVPRPNRMRTTLAK